MCNTQSQVASRAAIPQMLQQQAAYRPFGPAAEWTYGNGCRLYRTLDADYRPLSIQEAGAGGLSLGFGYDDAGNLTTVSSGSPPPLAYAYDALGRLTATENRGQSAISHTP